MAGQWSVSLDSFFNNMRCPAIAPKLILGALKTFETLLGERGQVERGLGGDVAGPLGNLQIGRASGPGSQAPSHP